MKHENIDTWIASLGASFSDEPSETVLPFDAEPVAKKAIAVAARAAVISSGNTIDGPDIGMSVDRFYERVLPRTGTYCLVSPRMQHYWYETLAELVAATIAKTQTGADWYFGTNGYDDTEGRKKTNVIAARSLRIDIDAGAEKFDKHGDNVYRTADDAMRNVAAFEAGSGLKASIIVKSGGGLHLYYTLAGDFPDMGEWLRASTALERLAQKFGLRIDTTVTKDEARILRPVGSLHNNGNTVHVIRDGDDITLEDLYACAERADVATEISAPVRVSKANGDGIGDADHPPAPTHDQVTAACPSLAAQVDSGFAGYDSYEAGLGVARHTAAPAVTAVVWFGKHPEFDKAAVLTKMHTFTGGPTTCKTIEGKLGSDAKCGTCKWKGKASTPIHASQKETGPDRTTAAREAAAGEAAIGPELTPEQQVVMDEINKGYFLAPEDLEYQIFADQSDAAVGVPRIKPVPEASMRLQWANKSVPVLQKDGSVKLVPAVSWWKASQQRREYSAGIGLRFDGKDDPNFFNLWKGFSVGPNRSSARLFLRHIRYICGRNSEQFKYLVQWMAFCIQNPGKRAETVVALRGPEGSGKGSIGRILTALFGTHALHISNGRHLTGNFNAHLRTALLMFIDEGYWAGDPAAEGVLKSLITEDQILIEQKGVDARMADNMLSMIMASNNDWLVPAGPQARRYFVVDVPDTLCNNWDYWERLNAWLDNGGRGAILGFLQRLDLSKFNIRSIPNTAALDDQKRLSLPPFMKWLESQLYVGSMDGTSDGGAWKSQVTCSAVIRNYAEYCAAQGRRYEATDAKTVSVKLGEVFGKLHRTRQLGGSTHRPYVWSIPTLAEARAKFCTAAGIGTIAWPEED